MTTGASVQTGSAGIDPRDLSGSVTVVHRRAALLGLAALAAISSPSLRTRAGATEFSVPQPEMRTWSNAEGVPVLKAKLIDCDYSDGRVWMLRDDFTPLLTNARNLSEEDRQYLLSFRDKPLNNDPAERVWRPADGGERYYIAGFKGYDEESNRVALERVDGAPLSVPLNSLSEVDREFIKGLLGGGNGVLSHLREIEASEGVPVAQVQEAAQYVAIYEAAVREITTVPTVRREQRVESVHVFLPQDRRVEGEVYSPNGGAFVVGGNGRLNFINNLLGGEARFETVNPVGGRTAGIASEELLPEAFGFARSHVADSRNLGALSYGDRVRVFGPPPRNFQFEIRETDVRGEKLQSPRGVAWTADDQHLLVVDKDLGAVLTYQPKGPRMVCTGFFPERGVLDNPERVAVSPTGEVAVSLANGSVVILDRSQRPAAVVSPLAGAGGAAEAYPVLSLHFVRGGGPHQGKLVVVRDGDGSMVYGSPLREGDDAARE